MNKAIGHGAFWIGVIALIVMLLIDVFNIRQVPTIWFASLALVLTGVMWAVPSLRPNFRTNRRG